MVKNDSEWPIVRTLTDVRKYANRIIAGPRSSRLADDLALVENVRIKFFSRQSDSLIVQYLQRMAPDLFEKATVQNQETGELIVVDLTNDAIAQMRRELQALLLFAKRYLEEVIEAQWAQTALGEQIQEAFRSFFSRTYNQRKPPTDEEPYFDEATGRNYVAEVPRVRTLTELLVATVCAFMWKRAPDTGDVLIGYCDRCNGIYMMPRSDSKYCCDECRDA